MGRLDDIIERNKNPKTSFRKPKAGPGDESATTAPEVDPPAEPAATKRPRSPLRISKPRGDEPPTKAATTAVNQAEQGEQKGRLDRIVARNQKPNANYRWLKVGLAGIVLFVVLVLLIFTDLAAPPDAAYPEPVPAAKPSGVGGVKLWKAPVKKSGSATK